MRFLFMNGRHFNLTLILSSQYVMDVPAAIRANSDYVFVFNDPIVNNRKRLYENYFGVLPKFSVFEAVFKACTADFECLVLDNTQGSSNVEDSVFWYKAPIHKPFKIGSPAYWTFDRRSYGEHDEGQTLVTVNGVKRFFTALLTGTVFDLYLTCRVICRGRTGVDGASNLVEHRCELLMEYLKEVIASGPIHDTAAGALEQLQEHLVRAYEVLRNCGKGAVYRVINYKAIKDEIVDVNTSISACLHDYQFFISVPRASQPHLEQLKDLIADVNTYEALRVKEDLVDDIPPEASDLDVAEPEIVAETVQMLARQGVFSLAELTAFQEEVLGNDAQMLRLVGIMGEEQQMLIAQKLASEEEYLKQIAELIARTEQAELSAPPERFLCIKYSR
ncbi:Hypothetical protein KFL_012910020 [Klebsormidium nitens]|uniref:Uncharacterized protein n=1 Tax=Klebsormidium nitens TaxID=105231 RepID=A0A1Y1IXR9_KLENI|nr:Hypothetical protein KFL_012910020 [Klebsormidium nitens]|eukprot:GAQ93088.1 Hypothetical protein KFL_012910020 [Klebsormidium nitens]